MGEGGTEIEGTPGDGSSGAEVNLRSGLLLGVLSSMALGGGCRPPAEALPPTATLRVQEALGGYRRFAPRFTFDRPAAPCAPDARTNRRIEVPICSPPPAPGSDAFRRLQQLVPELRRTSPDDPAGAARANAIWTLIWSEDVEAADRAIEALESATALQPGDATLFSDLSAALLVRAARGQDPRDLVAALNAAERAVELGADGPRPLWNRGLALEGLHLLRAARKSLEAELARFPEAAAADGVSDRLKRIDEALLRLRSKQPEPSAGAILAFSDAGLIGRLQVDPQQLREWSEDGLLPEWARAWEANRRERSDRLLDAASKLGRALRASRQESLLSRVAEELESGSDELRSVASRAWLALERGRQAYRQFEVSEAESAFRRSLAGFERARSSAAVLARLGLAACGYQRLDVPRARDLTLASLEQAHAMGSLSAEAKAEWTLGAIASTEQDLGGALEHLGKAAVIYERLGERSNREQIEIRLQDTWAELGNEQRAWDATLEVLRETSFRADPRPRFLALYGAGLDAEALGYPRAAKILIESALAEARRSRDQLPTVFAGTELAELRRELGDRDGALRDLGQLEADVSRIEEPAERGRLEADRRLAIAEAQIERDAAAAASTATGVLAELSTAATPTQLSRARLIQARAERRTGNFDVARSLLERAGVDLAGLISRVPATERRDALDLRWDTVVELTILEALDLGRPLRGLANLERARCSALRYARCEAGTFAMASDWTALLPADGALVDFLVDGDDLLVWIVTRDGHSFRHLSGVVSDLGSKIEALRAAAGKGDVNSAGQLGRALAGELFGNAKQLLVGVPEWVVIADGDLWSIPWICLRLAEPRADGAPFPAVRMAVSALASPRREPEHEPNPGHALVVASPAFDRRLFPSLAELSGADAEIEAVRQLGLPTIALTGLQADPDSILRALPGSRVVHLAMHSVERDRRHGGVAFVAAPSLSAPTGLLSPRRLREVDMSASRLVILAGCGTARGAVDRSGGGAGLAGAFLDVGAGVVVASLGQLEDVSGDMWLSTFVDRLRHDESLDQAFASTLTLLLTSESAQRRSAALSTEIWTSGLYRSPNHLRIERGVSR